MNGAASGVLGNFQKHLYRNKHGEYATRKVKSKYDVYKYEEEYCCPDCDYRSGVLVNFREHLRRRKHGDFKGQKKK